MSIDAVALLPALAEPPASEPAEGDWRAGEGPAGGAMKVWRPLRDGTLLNLALPFQSSDADLFEAATRWFGPLPARVWVFPDTAVPDGQAASEILAGTRGAGRWIHTGPTK